MVMVSEMPRTKRVAGMDLGEIRQQLARFKSGQKLEAAELARLQVKLRGVMVKLAEVGRRGGLFAAVRASEDVVELYEHSRWA